MAQSNSPQGHAMNTITVADLGVNDVVVVVGHGDVMSQRRPMAGQTNNEAFRGARSGRCSAGSRLVDFYGTLG